MLGQLKPQHNFAEMSILCNKLQKILFAFILIIIGRTITIAQRPPDDTLSLIGISIGSSHYYGDLAPLQNFLASTNTLPRWSLSAHGSLPLTSKLSVRTSFNWVRVVGDDYTFASKNINKFQYQFLRNLHFKNDIAEVNFCGIYHFNYLSSKFRPYVLLGIGTILQNPKARGRMNFVAVKSDWLELREYNTSGQGISIRPRPYSLLNLSFPIGFGFKYPVSKKLIMSFEVNFRQTTSDWIDDVGNASFVEDLYTFNAVQGKFAYLNNRANEVYTARTGIDRMNGLQQIFNQNNIGKVNLSKMEDLMVVFGYSKRGKRGLDSYMTTQFGLSYVIGKPKNKLKKTKEANTDK